MSLVTRCQGDSIVMGDLNEVRSVDERMGSVFNIQGVADFNDFISKSGLVDIQLEGYSFTWSHPSASKMSKLDRFLVTEGVISLFLHISAICLDRHLSDHWLILLRDVIADYGATPFRLYHSWLTLSGSALQFINGKKQKAKIQWAIEGDENSKFFHRVINRKRANLAIRGVMVDSEWVDDPRRVKEEFCSHFATKFHAPSGIRNKINFLFPNQLSSDQAFELEKQVSTDEIRTTVWACGENKSPGPDGFTFEFFRKFWDTIGPDLCLVVEWLFDHGLFSKGCNSSFIALIPKVQDPKFVNDYRPISLIGSLYKVVTKILALWLSLVIAGLISDVQTTFLPSRQILDRPFVINELLSWCKYKKQHAMIFKVDFAKAYDSIRWDFLDDVFQLFGFGFKWRSWNLGSLSSGMAFVLINGSPTAGFQFHCGLKQGDPLAPYLFIFVMESLHLSFSRVVDAGIFKGIKIDNSTMISHLFYADDAVFVGEWSDDNLSSIMHVLHCFSLASGLKINVKKSHLLGVGIHDLIVAAAASTLGCSIMKTPFKYLGVTVGGNMSKISAWDDIISKLNSRLSKWKVKTLSIGGRLTLLKSVLGSTPIYWMSLYKVPKAVLNSMETIRRNFFNGAQDNDKKITWVKWTKWVWRYISHDNSLWYRVISAIHGPNIQKLSSSTSSIWNNILKEVNILKGQGVDLISHLAVKLQGDVEFSLRRQARGGVEAQQLVQLQDLIGSSVLVNAEDRWFWDLNENGVFCVKDVRKLLYESFLPKEVIATRWIKFVPIKINVFAWKVSLDRLPTRVNLIHRGSLAMIIALELSQCISIVTYVFSMIKLRVDVELKDNIVVAMPKVTREGFYTCNIHVEYEWKPPRCACCKVFGHFQEECPKNIGAGETKNLKKPSQTLRGVPVGQKVGFKLAKQVFQPVSKKPTASTSGTKKKNMEPTKEVSKSNPFDVLTSVEHDEDLGTNGGTSNLASQEANSSGSSFWNVNSITLVDDEGKPLEKVESSGDYDSEDEVASVDNEMASILVRKDGYGTNSLLEQWNESYENDDYDYDPYDDDMYGGFCCSSLVDDEDTRSFYKGLLYLSSENSLELRLLGAERAQEKMMIHFQCKVPSLLKVEIIYFWCESLAEALGIQPRVMPEDGYTRLIIGDDISWLCWKTGFCCSSLVDDEDTRSFYKGLLYLAAHRAGLEIAWDKDVSPLEHGDVGIGSFRASKFGMLAKSSRLRVHKSASFCFYSPLVATSVWFVCSDYGKKVLSPKGRRCGKGVKKKKNSLVDDFATDINRVNKAAGSESTTTKNSKLVSGTYPVMVGVIGKQSDVKVELEKNGYNNGNKKDLSSIVAKIQDMKRQLLEGKRVLMVEDGLPMKKADGQIMDRFPSLANTFSTLYRQPMLLLMFSSKYEMDAMLENGPLLVRNVPLIPRKWYFDAKLLKEDVCNVSMSCYARAMIEDAELKESLVVVVPKITGGGYIMHTLHIEYE
ncbi:RNA-directed DNA polymerase, eukaryota [Tanacetum coccineum]